MTDKSDREVAAWAITQNERLYNKMDAIAERSVIVEWSLGRNYRSDKMQPGDRALFWLTGTRGGIARIGFFIDKRATKPRTGFWTDTAGKRHKAGYWGRFFLPPLPNRRYIHRSALEGDPRLANCELLTTAAQSQPPLLIEPREWKAIEQLLFRFDRANSDFRAPWPA